MEWLEMGEKRGDELRGGGGGSQKKEASKYFQSKMK